MCIVSLISDPSGAPPAEEVWGRDYIVHCAVCTVVASCPGPFALIAWEEKVDTRPFFPAPALIILDSLGARLALWLF